MKQMASGRMYEQRRRADCLWIDRSGTKVGKRNEDAEKAGNGMQSKKCKPRADCEIV